MKQTQSQQCQHSVLKYVARVLKQELCSRNFAMEVITGCDDPAAKIRLVHLAPSVSNRSNDDTIQPPAQTLARTSTPFAHSTRVLRLATWVIYHDSFATVVNSAQ
jgi:hypothetical protein